MNKKLLSIFIIISILVTALSVPTVAADNRASNYMSICHASLSPGSSSGELVITYRVTAAVTGVTRIGALAMFIYRTDGSIARTIVGSTSNGLMKTSGTTVSGTYRTTVTPGETYYCKVTFIVENSTGNDIRDFTTNTTVAPT